MSTVLRASGTNFDVDLFLKDSSLRPLTVFRRGEMHFPPPNVAQRTSECSGMIVSVSIREFVNLKGQVEDAVGFLSKNEGGLKRLRDFPGVEGMDLDFPIEARDVVFQSDAFPPPLLSLMGGLRIGLIVSRYPVHLEAKD